MATATAREPIVVGTYGFNVPCRRFMVAANITRDRRIPVVDEFVLRILKVCERLPIKRLGSFLGFSTPETEAVVIDLMGRGLVEVQGELISLHPSAGQMFRGSPDELPRMVEIDTWVDRIWFDLVSKNMVAPERSRPTRNLIELRADNAAREMPVSFVRNAFQSNFAEYLKRVRRINSPERFGLYSISEVEAERYGSLVITGSEELVFDPHPQLRPKLFEVEIENLARYRDLSNAMTDAYMQLWWPEPTAASLDEFQRLVGDDSVRGAHQDGQFDLQQWLTRNEHIGALWQTIIGASYLKRNTDFLVRLIDQRSSDWPVKTNASEVSLVWFRPAGTGWGRTDDLRSAIATIKASIRTKKPKLSIRTTLVMPPALKRENYRAFERVFDEAYFSPPKYLGPEIEVVLIDDIAACVLVPVQFSPTVFSTVGFLTADPKSISRIKDGLLWETTKARSQECWNRPRQKFEGQNENWTEGESIE